MYAIRSYYASEELAATSEELAAQAEQLKATTEFFKIKRFVSGQNISGSKKTSQRAKQPEQKTLPKAETAVKMKVQPEQKSLPPVDVIDEDFESF